MAQAVAQVLHELATNAVKYGGLRPDGAGLSLGWRVMGDAAGQSEVAIDWVERGCDPSQDGPPGTGTRLARALVEHELGGRWERSWRGTDLHYSIGIPSRLAQPVPPESTS